MLHTYLQLGECGDVPFPMRGCLVRLVSVLPALMRIFPLHLVA